MLFRSLPFSQGTPRFSLQILPQIAIFPRIYCSNSTLLTSFRVPMYKTNGQSCNQSALSRIKQLSDLFFIVSLQIFHQIVEHMPACISAAVCKASKPYPCGQPLCSFLCTKKLPISRKFLKMVEVTGFEPATFWSRTKRATKLRYTSKMEPMKGLEPLTCGLRNRCSTD